MDTFLSDDPYLCVIGNGRQARRLCISLYVAGYFDQDFDDI